MTIKVLECRDLIPDSRCTLSLIGQVDELVPAFTDHVARLHAEGEHDFPRATIEAKLQNAVFVSPDRAYVGDQVDFMDDGAIGIRGDGFLIQRFFQPEELGAGGAKSAAATLLCRCTSGVTEGTCDIQLDGTTARCIRNTCLTCGWSTTIPAFAPPDKIMSEFD